MADKIEQLKKLKQLFEDGLIDQAEFDLLKTDLLQIDKAESVTQLSSEPDKKLDKQKEHSTEEAQKAGEAGVAAAEAKPAGVPIMNSPKKKKSSKVSKGILIALSCFVLVGLLYFGYRLFMNGQVEAAKAEEGSVTEVNGENYGGGYVFAGHSVLLDTPSDEGLELATLSYGSQFQYLSHEKVEVENEIYRQVIADGQEGWIKTNIEGLELTCEDEALNTLSYLVTGEFKDNLLSEIPAYVKWALADYSRSGDFTIDCHQDSIQKVIMLRSRLQNRRSSADKREGINDEPKDAIFLNRSSDGKQLLVMLNFSSYTNWTVTELPIANEANFIGLKRVKRRTTLEVIDRFGALEQLNLEFDACKVYSEEKGIFYYYGPDGTMARYAPSTGGVFPTFDAFKSEVVDSLGADFYCDFTNYYYAIASNYVLHESVEGVDVNRYVFFTPERVGLDLEREEISLYFPDGEYSHTVTIYNEPYTRQTEYGLQEHSRTCEIQKENWTVTLSGGGRTREEDIDNLIENDISEDVELPITISEIVNYNSDDLDGELPKPTIYFGGKTGGTIKKVRAIAVNQIVARLENNPLNISYTVVEFMLYTTKAGAPVRIRAKGNRISSEMKNAIKRIKLGGILTFAEIKIKGPSGKVTTLDGSLTLTLI
jgi:hypothetical protein